MTTLGPTLQTDRLILRPPAVEDFEPWSRFMADPEAAQFIGGVMPPPVVWRYMATMAGAWALHGFAMFSVIEKDSGLWVGRVGPWEPLGWPGPEVGWGIVRERWGRGYATEAAAASMDWCFDVLGWTEVIHTIDPNNLASEGVARRLGSTHRGPGRLPPPMDAAPVEIWGQTRADWRR